MQDNCFIIQQIVNETDFVARKALVVQRFVRFRTNFSNLRISQDICYVRMTDNNDFLTIYGHRANLLNKRELLFKKFARSPYMVRKSLQERPIYGLVG